MKIQETSLRRTKPQLILANGSERGDFVPMAEVYAELKRPHDGIQLMKTYYPYDPAWTTQGKVSQVSQLENVQYIWDYEYDNYDPLDIFEDNSTTLTQMRDIKKFGSDIHLTLTMDITLPDSELENIILKIRNFGRIYLRINHEINGSWFIHNHQYSYRQAAEFFLRFQKIIRARAPQILTVLSFSGDVKNPEIVKDEHLVVDLDILKEALASADFWSIDKYPSLDWGWPFYEIDRTKPGRYWSRNMTDFWRNLDEFYIKLIWAHDGKPKKIFISEFNSDARVDGEKEQAMNIYQFYDRLLKGDYHWIEGVALYQYRDYAGLGLQTGDLKSFKNTQSLQTYRKVIQQFNYQTDCLEPEWKHSDFTFSWISSDSIRGMKISWEDNHTGFKNNLEVAVFVLIVKGKQLFSRLEPGQTLSMDGIKSIDLFVPPYFQANGEMRTAYLFRKAADMVQGMLV